MAKSDVIMDATSRYTPRELYQGTTVTSPVGIIWSVDGVQPVVLNFPTAGGSGGIMSRRASKVFTVRAWGRVTGAGVTSFQVLLGYGTTMDLFALTSMPAARAVDNESENWYLEALLIWDSTSNKLNGQNRVQIGAQIDPWTANIQVPDNVDVPSNLDDNTPAGLVMLGHFSVSFAGNQAFLDGFQLEED